MSSRNTQLRPHRRELWRTNKPEGIPAESMDLV